MHAHSIGAESTISKDTVIDHSSPFDLAIKVTRPERTKPEPTVHA